MIKTSHTLLTLSSFQKNTLDSICDIYTKVKHTGFKLIAQSNVDLFKNNLLNKSKDKLTSKNIITSLSSEQKKFLANKFNLTGRHINSINIELGMIISSYIEQRNNHLDDLIYNLTKINQSITKYNKANLELESKFSILQESKLHKQIYAYQQFIINRNLKSKINKNKINSNNINKDKLQFIFTYKDCGLPSIIKPSALKALLSTPKYKEINSRNNNKLLQATQSYGKNLFQLHILNKKLNRIKSKIKHIELDINQGKLRICFGTKALFKQQNLFKFNNHVDKTKNKNKEVNHLNNNGINLQSILYKDHIDWLLSWYDSRSHQFLITGAGEEASGNLNCQAVLNPNGLFDIKLRLPDELINHHQSNNFNNYNKQQKLNLNQSGKDNKYLTIHDVDFGKNNSLLQSSLLSETKEVRVLSIAEKQEIKDLKNTLFELKKARFKLIKEIKLLKKSDIFTDKRILGLDNEINSLQKDIAVKSDIFNFDKSLSNKVLSNKENDNLNEIKPKQNSALNNSLRTRKKKLALPITYRFVKNTERKSPKYGAWSVHFTVDVKEPDIITDVSLGSIGVDLNANHLAVSEVSPNGELIQSFNIYFNPDTYNSSNNNIKNNSKSKNDSNNKIKPFKLIDSNNNSVIELPFTENQFKLNEKINHKLSEISSNNSLSEISSDKAQNILGNAIKIITELSLRTGKPIIIEKLDFTQKKKQLSSTYKLNNNNFNYNHMISSFAYSKFKEILKAQAARSGLQVIEVNPAYSSLIGLINYVKPLGLSIHMAASYVIALRGLNYLNNKIIDKNITIKLTKSNYQIDEKPRIIKIENKHKLEIYTKSKVYLLDYIVNSNITEDIPNNINEWSVISNLYKSLQKDICKEKLHNKKLNLELKLKLKSLMESAPAPNDGLDLSYLFSDDNLQVHDT